MPVYPVQGEVYVDGEPAAGATVTFSTPKPTDVPICPTAVVKPDGSFELTGYKPGDGAPVGEYVVTVSWCDELPKQERGDETPVSNPDKLGGRFSDPRTSTLKATIHKGKNKIPRFVLSRN